MRLDRKFLLIAPSAVLVLIVAGMFYIAAQMQMIVAGSDTWQERHNFVTSVQQGQKTLSLEKSVELLQYSLDAEQRRTLAIVSARQTLLEIAWIALLCTGVLLWNIRRVPRTEPLRGKVLFNSSPAPRESAP